jgi:UDP-N-acetylmuramoyl-tripeptide--D-alanyl-D-alanine ligase
VANLLETARSLADAARLRISAKIIGVTGSVGKTSVKDALSHVLSTRAITHATEANANDGWGVLDTLMNMPLDAGYAVMELGMLGVGSIKIKSERIKPDVGIITNIHDAHVAYHGDESSIARTKSGLIDGLVPNGVAVLPRDSAWYDFLKNKAVQARACEIITFGTHPEADFRLVKMVIVNGGNIVHANLLGHPVTFRIGASGDHWGLNAMAILAAVHAVESDVDAAVSAMATIKPSFRRGEVHRVNADSTSFTIIDDTWNASPTSVVAALKNMATIEVAKGDERVLFIGDMLQLGINERQKHVELAGAIIANGIDKVFTVGGLSKSLFQALPLALRGHHFPDAATASKMAKECVGNGDVVLVKGSNAMQMWRVVRALREMSTSNDIAGTQSARTRREGAAI